jgi:hypothetical protein
MIKGVSTNHQQNKKAHRKGRKGEGKEERKASGYIKIEQHVNQRLRGDE